MVEELSAGAAVPSIESAHCVLIFEQNEENAINLQKAIAESEQQIPVLNSDWIATCLKRGHMLGPGWKPEWGGHRVKYYPKVEEFFKESENIKEEDSERKIEVIDLTLSENEEDEEKPLEQLNSEPDGQIFTRARGRPEDPRTAAQILSIISKKTAKYKIEDLVLLVKELASTTRGTFRATFRDLGATYRAEGKDYGLQYNSWANLFNRNQEDYKVCIKKLRQGDISLDNLLPSKINLNNTGIPIPPPNPSTSAAAESETCADSCK
ncbi:hypothetical protein FS837_009487 [Tulasnella sp. UAMH 9824]|nr:hypothetical protein FS837_009487 [Tulasnella sp. UAMH 9824]